MLTISGRIKSKNILKSGVSEKGEWKIIEFSIAKQYNEEQLQIAFVALGKVAEIVDTMPLKRKVTINFLPKCKMFNNKWYTELKVLTIEDWKKKEPYNPHTPYPNTDTRTVAEVKVAPKEGEQLQIGGENDALDQAMERSRKESQKDKTPSPANADLPFKKDEESEEVKHAPISREQLLEKGKSGAKKGSKKSPF